MTLLTTSWHHLFYIYTPSSIRPNSLLPLPPSQMILVPVVTKKDLSSSCDSGLWICNDVGVLFEIPRSKSASSSTCFTPIRMVLEDIEKRTIRHFIHSASFFLLHRSYRTQRRSPQVASAAFSILHRHPISDRGRCAELWSAQFPRE